MDDKIYIIDLNKYRAQRSTGISKVFTGRDRGKTVREKSEIDKMADKYEKVIIQIPADISSINPSFLEELNKNVVRKYGKEKFMKKIEFKCLGEYDVTKSLDEAINRILHNETAIG
ncbi:MAG: STAS-like domain-containing protein [Prevotella sp.]|nr:STAS-like domain-containing protein [Prevotella sp.]